MFEEKIKSKVTLMKKYEAVFDKLQDILVDVGLVGDNELVKGSDKYEFLKRFVYLNTASILLNNELEKRGGYSLSIKVQDEINDIVLEIIVRFSEHLNAESNVKSGFNVNWN